MERRPRCGSPRTGITSLTRGFSTSGRSDEIAAGLRSLGIVKGDIVALNSETRLEFYLSDLGIMANGSIAAAMYPSYPPKDLIRRSRP